MGKNERERRLKWKIELKINVMVFSKVIICFIHKYRRKLLGKELQFYVKYRKREKWIKHQLSNNLFK